MLRLNCAWVNLMDVGEFTLDAGLRLGYRLRLWASHAISAVAELAKLKCYMPFGLSTTKL